MKRFCGQFGVCVVLIIHGLGLCHSQLLGATGIGQPACTENRFAGSNHHSEEPVIERVNDEFFSLDCAGHMMPRSVDRITIDAVPVPAFALPSPIDPPNGMNLSLREPATHPGVPDVGHLLPLLF